MNTYQTTVAIFSLFLFFSSNQQKNNDKQTLASRDSLVKAEVNAGTSIYAFTFCYDGKLCLRNKYPIGARIALIQDQIYYATTMDTGSVVSEYNPESNYSFTSLSLPEHSVLMDSSCLAIIDSSISTYRPIASSIVSDTSISNRLSDLSRNSTIVDTLLKRNAGGHYSLSNDIPNSLPGVIAFEDSATTCYVLNYKMNFGLNGPRILIMNDRVYPLTGQCSFDTFRVFRLNGELFYESGSYCCECGINGKELFTISQTGPSLIYADYSWSD